MGMGWRGLVTVVEGGLKEEGLMFGLFVSLCVRGIYTGVGKLVLGL